MKRLFSNRKDVLFGLLLITLFVFLLLNRQIFKLKQIQSLHRNTTASLGSFELEKAAIIAAAQQRSLEAYNKRNAEITERLDANIPENSGNAALFYYPSFLLLPEPNQTMNQKLLNVCRGTEPDREVRIFLENCLTAMKLYEIATRIRDCTWDIWPGQSIGLSAVSTKVINLRDSILTDAMVLAKDGQYRAALGQCLTLRRFAHHLNQDRSLFLLSQAVDTSTMNQIPVLLSTMSFDTDLLTWFKSQFNDIQETPLYFNNYLDLSEKIYLSDNINDSKYIASMNSIYSDGVMNLKNLLKKASENEVNLTDEQQLMLRDGSLEKTLKLLENLTDEQLLSQYINGHQSIIRLLRQIINSDATYETKISQIQEILNKLGELKYIDPILDSILYVHFAASTGSYHTQIEQTACINAIRTAIEIYLIIAETGQLPQVIPEGLPKDPFTDQNFLYEKTEDGFSLRCKNENLAKTTGNVFTRFDFKVQNLSK
jgi:hypothetical protein